MRPPTWSKITRCFKCQSHVTYVACQFTTWYWRDILVRESNPSENWHKGEIAKSRDIAAAEACRGRSWNTYIFSHRESHKPHCVFEFTRPNLQKEQNGMIIKWRVKIGTSQIGAAEGACEIQNISSSNSQNHISETKMVRQLRRHATARIYQTSSKFSLSSSFSSPTTCCPVSAPLMWPCLSMSLLVSGSLALWTWLSVLALYLLLLSVCLEASVLLSGTTLVLDPWLPWLVRVVEYVVGDKLGLLLGWQGGGGRYSTCIL